MKYTLNTEELLSALAKKYDLETGRYRLALIAADLDAEELVFDVICLRKGPKE